MAIKSVFVAALLAVLFCGAAARADDVKDRAYALLMGDILQRNEGGTQGIGRYSGDHSGVKNRYRNEEVQKALVACIVWAEATPDRIPIKHWNFYARTRRLDTAENWAMTYCRSLDTTDCVCQIVDENDENVLQVPSGYPPKSDSKKPVSGGT